MQVIDPLDHAISGLSRFDKISLYSVPRYFVVVNKPDYLLVRHRFVLGYLFLNFGYFLDTPLCKLFCGLYCLIGEPLPCECDYSCF